MAVHYERIGHTAVVTIARPAVRNAIDAATAAALYDAWQRFAGDRDAYVAVLTGAGDHFSAGADLKKLDLEDGPGGYLGFTRLAVGKPTIAAVSGYCVAGGLEMALWCDLRVASTTAVFGCFERRWGVPLVDGGTQRLPRVVGLSRALDMILTGRAVDAEEAYRIGLADRVVPAAQEMEAALDLATIIGRYPQETLRSDRAALYAGLGKPIEEGLAIERTLGKAVVGVAAAGAGRFAAGEGRHAEGVE